MALGVARMEAKLEWARNENGKGSFYLSLWGFRSKFKNLRFKRQNITCELGDCVNVSCLFTFLIFLFIYLFLKQEE